MDLYVYNIVVIFLSSAVPFTESFNIDIENVVVHRNRENGTGFGYTAEFVQFPNTTIRLLVGAPRTPVTKNQSGIHFYCTPGVEDSCARFTASSEQIEAPGGEDFSERDEVFGLAMAIADKNTAVVCGPLWRDLKFIYRASLTLNVGRCRLLPERNGPGIKPYFNSTGRGYQADIYVYDRLTKQLLNGAAEFGFSADSDGSGRVVIGAPGYSVSRGGIAVYDTKTNTYNKTEMIFDQEPDSVFGFDVAVGNFCGSERFCFVASNKLSIAKVYLIEHVAGHRVPFRVLWQKVADQGYSSFGSVLCAADVTGDGWADLMVGAPLASLNVTLAYDVGAVFVYVSHGEAVSGAENFYSNLTLTGDNIPFSRFGSAITSIGDINRDFFNDLAVGAPLEEGGVGAVYIYLGGSSGPQRVYSQKIRGRDFSPTLSSFGAHISKPTSDLSDYAYPDFAVGAPESGAVVFLRTRLILNAEVRVRATPNPVDPMHQVCPPEVSLDSGCLNISLCLNYTYQSSRESSRLSQEYADFDVSLELDSLISSETSRRVRLLDGRDGSTLTLYKTVFTVPRNKGRCQSYLAILNKDQIDRNPFVPMDLTAAFSLNVSSVSAQVPPVLNQSMPTSFTEQVKFKNKCGDEGEGEAVCEPDLVLSGRVQHVPAGDSYTHLNVVNRTSQVELVLDLLNRGETSFGVRLTVNISGQINFRAATGNANIQCDPLVTSELLCRSWGPLGDGAAVRFRLMFHAHTVPLTQSNKVISFKAKVMPFDPVYNPEKDETNNGVSLQSQTALVADLKLDGWADPRQVHVQESDKNDVTVTHKLLAVNRGPSFLPATSLLIHVPFIDSAGTPILALSNVTMRRADGRVEECPHHLGTGGSQGGGSSSPVQTTTATTPLTTTTAATTGLGTTTEDLFGPIEPSRKRRRRQAENSQSNDIVSGSDNDKVMKIDCINSACRVYDCGLPDLQSNEKAEINVTVTIQRSAITFPGKVDTLQYTVTTKALEPKHPLFYPWEREVSRQTWTSLKLVSSGDGINIWIIVGGVIGGVFLLIIITIVAWKLGFFKRKERAKLERLKRQSGFYESKGSTKSRKSQRSSSSGTQK